MTVLSYKFLYAQIAHTDIDRRQQKFKPGAKIVVREHVALDNTYFLSFTPFFFEFDNTFSQYLTEGEKLLYASHINETVCLLRTCILHTAHRNSSTLSI